MLHMPQAPLSRFIAPNARIIYTMSMASWYHIYAFSANCLSFGSFIVYFKMIADKEEVIQTACDICPVLCQTAPET